MGQEKPISSEAQLIWAAKVVVGECNDRKERMERFVYFVGVLRGLRMGGSIDEMQYETLYDRVERVLLFGQSNPTERDEP